MDKEVENPKPQGQLVWQPPILKICETFGCDEQQSNDCQTDEHCDCNVLFTIAAMKPVDIDALADYIYDKCVDDTIEFVTFNESYDRVKHAKVLSLFEQAITDYMEGLK